MPGPPLDPLPQAGGEVGLCAAKAPLPQAGGEESGRKRLFRERPTRRAQELRRNMTRAEALLWRHLSRRQLAGWKFSRQMPVGPYICDFSCREAKLVVEVDGGQHHARAEADARRTAAIEAEGYRVIRFWNNEVFENLEGVLQRISDVLEQSRPHPRPLPRAGGEI